MIVSLPTLNAADDALGHGAERLPPTFARILGSAPHGGISAEKAKAGEVTSPLRSLLSEYPVPGCNQGAGGLAASGGFALHAGNEITGACK